MDTRPIGVFDSGLGGLTAVRQLRRVLPGEDIVYFGDTGRVPYGSRGRDIIVQYARQDIRFLLSQNVKFIIAACGTVSSTYPPEEAAKLPVPFTGVVGATARAAVDATKNGKIGIIGTAATVRSGSYAAVIRDILPGVEIYARACPMFVPLVENGYFNDGNPVTQLIIAEYLQELKDAGYAMNDTIGLFGAESAFESYLRGTNGRRVVSFNDQGKVTGETYSVEPVPGGTVSLTIDEGFQRDVEDALASVIEGLTAKDGVTRGGAAAVIQVGTGEVLALASYPDYDLSRYFQDYQTLSSDSEGRPLVNRATNGTYPPGSTLKPITAFAALDSGVTTVSETLFDSGHWTYPSSWGGGLNCWKRSGHGRVTVTSAITGSCNYYFAEMGYRMGMNTLRDYYAAFGLGSKTGIEIGDAAGSLPSQPEGQDLAPWAAFGQATQLYSPIQLANALATLVSGGQHCPAHLLKEVRSADGGEVLALGDSTPLNTIDIKPEYLDAIKKGMLGYTTGSLAGYFKDCVVTAGAKTGTAQMGGEAENNGVFICFGPYEDPEIAVAIVVEKAGAGANITPAAVAILNAWFSAPEIDTPIQGEDQLVP